MAYPLVISYIDIEKWPSRHSGFTQLHSMVDLSSSQIVNIYQAGVIIVAIPVTVGSWYGLWRFTTFSGLYKLGTSENMEI